MNSPAASATTPHITLVAAVARNGVIGHAGGLVWSDPADLQHFRRLTQGHAVLMGRKTWDSLPARFRPLPGRRNLVVSRQRGLQLPGAEVHGDLPLALAALRSAGAAETVETAQTAQTQGGPRPPAPTARVFVIGGGELYAQTLPLAAELVLTEVAADLAGDTVFPVVDPAVWRPVQREAHCSAAGLPFAFVTYRRAAA